MAVRTIVHAALVLSLSGCSGVASSPGTDEPIRVQGAQYRRGPLPGAPPVDGGAIEGPFVTAFELATSFIYEGQESKSFSGRVSPDTYALAVGFVDLGNAHWLLPPGGPDFTNQNELTWSIHADFGRDIPPGPHRLGFVAIDANGVPGPQRIVDVCVYPDVPDNYNACDPLTFTPPDTIITLSWNTEVDLDLVVVTPEGKVVSAKKPSTVLVDGGAIPEAALDDPATGLLTRDSNGACHLDGRRRESLVFQGVPPSGEYRVYANLFSPCGQSTVDFQVSVYRSTEAEGGGRTLSRTDLASGQLLAVNANQGTALGTFANTVVIP